MDFDKAYFINTVPEMLVKSKKQFKNANEIERKQQAMLEFEKGVTRLKYWIDNESDPMTKKFLNELYAKVQGDLQKMKSIYKELIDYMDKKRLANFCTPLIKNTNETKAKANLKYEPMIIQNGQTEDKDAKFTNNIITKKTDLDWDSVAGLKAAKEALKEAVILPIKFPQLFQGIRTPWKGILLYGPPGTGKTFLAKVCAAMCDATFISVSSADILSKYVGESEKMVKNLFDTARNKRPAIIFIDEIDSLCSARSDKDNESTKRVKTEFLVQMQGVGNNNDGILVLGATNIPWGLDEAVRRRFEKRIYIPLPDYEARLQILQKSMKDTPNTLTAKDFKELAQKTEGYSGSDLSILIRDAALEPVRLCQKTTLFSQVISRNNTYYIPVPEYEKKNYNGSTLINKKLEEIEGNQLKVPEIRMQDFLVSLKRTKPSVNKEQLDHYIKFTKEFGQEAS